MNHNSADHIMTPLVGMVDAFYRWQYKSIRWYNNSAVSWWWCQGSQMPAAAAHQCQWIWSAQPSLQMARTWMFLSSGKERMHISTAIFQLHRRLRMATLTRCQLQSVTKTHYALPGSTAYIWAILIHPAPCDCAFTEPTHCTPCQDPRWTTVHSTKGSYGIVLFVHECSVCTQHLSVSNCMMSNATPPPVSDTVIPT